MSSTLRSSSDFGAARDAAMPRCDAVLLGMLTLSEIDGLSNCVLINAKNKLLFRDDAYASILPK